MPICVECGAYATEGSLKHPYCKSCFLRVWGNDYDRYLAWLAVYHN